MQSAPSLLGRPRLGPAIDEKKVDNAREGGSGPSSKKRKNDDAEMDAEADMKLKQKKKPKQSEDDRIRQVLHDCGNVQLVNKMSGNAADTLDEALIGGGSFGKVYRVRGIVDLRSYAVKLIDMPCVRKNFKLDSNHTKIMGEVQRHSRLDHGHAAKYSDLFQSDDEQFLGIRMGFCSGMHASASTRKSCDQSSPPCFELGRTLSACQHPNAAVWPLHVP